MQRSTNDKLQTLLDQVARGQLSRRGFMSGSLAAAMLAACRSAPQGEQAIAAGENQANSQLKDSYDYIIVGAGASGSVIAGEISKTGADVLVVESGAADTAPTIGNPSIWFYNVGSPLDWSLPIEPTPQLNNRKFKMAL